MGKSVYVAKKLLFIHDEVWPEPSLRAQTSVFIAFTGDSPSGLEADQSKKVGWTRNLLSRNFRQKFCEIVSEDVQKTQAPRVTDGL